jgi:acyl carrier protein
VNLDTDQIREGLYECLMDTLGLDKDDLVPSAKFFEDLGGESIDLLDLSFRCEKRFGIKVQFEKMFSLEDLALDERGHVSREGIAKIKAKFPFLDMSEIEAEPGVSQLRELLTVATLTQYLQMRVMEKLALAANSAPAPGLNGAF